MGLPTVGSVFLINFPFADLKTYKKRPAVIVAHGSLNTVILCQITSRRLPGVNAVQLESSDFYNGGLPVTSYVRTDKLFTVDNLIAQNLLGELKIDKIRDIRNQVGRIFK